MKRISLERLALLAAALCCAWAMSVQAAPPEQLTLGDLSNHPERWPDKVSLKVDGDIDGAHYSKGDTLELVNFDGSNVVLASNAGQQIQMSAGDCDLVEASNDAWSKLTPAQRAVDMAAIVADPSLWPAKVAMRTALGSGEHLRQDAVNIPAGMECTLTDVTGSGVSLIAALSGPTLFQALPQQTDLFARARERAAMPPEQRPSRIAAAFKGLAVDAKGQPYTGSAFDDAKIYVLYFGASWCGPCRRFSPGFVKFIKENSASNPHLAVAMLNNDKDPAKMLAYMQSEKMPFPSVPFAALQANYTLLAYEGNGIPQLVVTDRYGKVLANTFENNAYVGPEKTLADLKKILSAGAAK